jgi:hypothetical protein
MAESDGSASLGRQRADRRLKGYDGDRLGTRPADSSG